MDTPKKWNKTVYWQMVQALVMIKKELKERGVETVWVLIPTDDKKLFKFETMMGFTVEMVLYDEKSGKHSFLMSQET